MTKRKRDLAQEDESYQVSCSILETGRTTGHILTDIATAINVQLMFEDSQIPFVPFKDYENLLDQDKSFIYGRSGSGKSRIIYEIIKQRLPSFNRVCVINPRPLVGVQSHRISLSKLIHELKFDDAVIWDNFPDDLIYKDIDTLKDVLKIISSKPLGCLLISLKPKYIEILPDITDISEFYKNNISYEKETIEKVIKEYGSSIRRFRNIYRKYIAKNLIHIAAILWQKEPVPITVLDYFKELVQNKAARLRR